MGSLDTSLLCPALGPGALSDDTRLTSDVYLTSDVCLSVAYIGPKSRIVRPRKNKIGTEVAPHHTKLDTTIKVKWSNVNLQGAGAYCGGLPHSLLNWVKQESQLMLTDPRDAFIGQ